MKRITLFYLAFILSISGFSQSKNVLIFSKTKGYRHGSIPIGNKAIEKLGQANGFQTSFSENSEDFNDANLKKYDAVIFNCTTGDILDNAQQAAFERYIQAGGGYVGIHAAADCEYNWPWYGELMGAFFASHPHNSNIREASILVTDKKHISTAHLPDKWTRTDEWYNYRSFYHDLHPLMYLDEHTYTGGTNGGKHAIAWYHEYDGGKAFYTGGGHNEKSYDEPDFLKHLLGGIEYAMDHVPLNYSKAYAKTLPEENRFEKTVLVNDLNNPMELAISKKGKIYFTELSGKLSVYNTKNDTYKLIHRFPLILKGGTGLIGITLDPKFEENRWAYVYYTPLENIESDTVMFHLSRFKIYENDSIDLASEQRFLHVPVHAISGAHHGGSLAFDSKGVLVLSTGDGTTPFPSDGFAPIDERPGKALEDAQRGTANTFDYKGKILKIIPKPDGSYDVPEGNLFPKGKEKTLPEIFAMGVRNPYRIAINPKTNTVYWGEIGPDAGADTDRGPRGYDEFNQGKEAGFYGWPYFIGNTFAYSDWDFETGKPRGKYNPNKPENDSPNNTGLRFLPKPKPAMIYYPYALSDKFPELGLGGRSAMAGQFYTFDPKNSNPRKFPEYYDGGLFVFEWMRNWMRVLRFDEQENYLRSEAFMPTIGDFRRPIDLAFGEDGVMYALEYGSVYGADNVDARLVKIEYNPFNRAPEVQARIIDKEAQEKLDKESFTTAERHSPLPAIKYTAGAVPFEVEMQARAKDLDFDDKASYSWSINGQAQKGGQFSFVHTFDKPGHYVIVAKATDKAGASSTDTLVVEAGNAPPNLEIESAHNRSFYWDEDQFPYQVKVQDAEDKKVDNAAIKTVYNYNPQPLAPSPDISGGAEIKNNLEAGSLGKTLIAKSDCKACHTLDQKSVGPSFTAIAARYHDDGRAAGKLAQKIIDGGGGNWGTEHVMSAHPQLSSQDATEMASYILSIADPNLQFKPISSKGQLKLEAHKAYNSRGYYTVKSEYTDKGAQSAPKQTGEQTLKLRFHDLRAMDADSHPGFVFDWGELHEGDYKAYLIYRNIDLTGIKSIGMEFASKEHSGHIEIRKNSIGGPIIGRIDFSPTGAWNKYKWSEGQIQAGESGFSNLYFVVQKEAAPYEKLVKPKTFRFNK
ncbi:ThuA domain-containing protein [Marinilongibacter aquaticus]|uniref:ThuA domain-containing protein n=1 Tax=Marinilongibacter aquaticus TaxID=2975157 RepID=UPI0021BDBCC3|nr:ThuA domain-containing protein [Marinilongibacter aquaticus]UBM58332.1 ThuA domain-containing protein [Marinilongibacter aquaticus]